MKRLQVLEHKEHRLDGRSIDPKRAMAMKKEAAKKIFVGGLNPEATEDTIREYFGTYGEVSPANGPISTAVLISSSTRDPQRWS